MCRVEYTFFTCGHTDDNSVDCELAQSYGPFFNRTGCVNYNLGGSTHSQLQCGKLLGFYCAKTQNGMIIEKCRDALQRLEVTFLDKNAEKHHLRASWESYRSETSARSHSLDSLASIPTYRNIDQQREQLIRECNGLEHRRQYLNTLIAHAYRNRHLLATSLFQPLWDGTSFDFDASIFPPHLLEPIRRQIPTPFSMAIAPVATNVANTTNQQYHRQQQQQFPQQGMVFPPIANPSISAPPLQQTRLTQQQMGSVTPKRQRAVTNERSPIGEDIIRGHTPEGETMEEKAVRYRDQLKAAAAQKTADSMSKQGYDVQQYGISPAPKIGARRPARPRPTPSGDNGSPVASPKSAAKPRPTPAKVRRSARTRNTKPKYTDSPGDAESGSPSFKDRSDPAWNASVDESDDSWSPEMQVKGGRGQGRRATLNSTTSSASSPTRGKVSLSNKIADYQRSVGHTGTPAQKLGATSLSGNPSQPGPQASLHRTPQVDSPQLPNTIDGLHHSNQQSLNANPSSTYGQHGQTAYPSNPMRGQPHAAIMTQEAFQRAAATQRSTYLAQQLGRNLYHHQLASGIVGAPARGAMSSPQSPQEAASPSMPHGSHFTQTHALSGSPLQSASNQFGHFGGMNYGGLPMAPPNIFHQNYQNSMGSNGRSFSMHSMPTSGVSSPLGRNSPMQTLNSNFQPNLPGQHDYESMRRSFSSTPNLTPQATMTGDHAVADSSPTKRSMPPSSPTAVRKRVRLSLPVSGEDEAPVLQPSTSSFQLHAPAGLPADDTVDFAASIEAIEAFEREHAANLAAQPTTQATFDPQHPVPQDEATQRLAGIQETAKETRDTSSLPMSQYSTQSYGTAQNFGDAILVPSNMGEQGSQPSQSDFKQQSQKNANHIEDEVKDTASEPEWDLLADDVFSMP